MSKKLKTRSRSYESIAGAADKHRRIGDLETHINFDITAYINGPLRFWLRTERGVSLDVVFDDALSTAEPANVEIDWVQLKIVLSARTATWAFAADHHPESRRVLAHEIGHIALHGDEVFGFSEVSEAEHRFIPNDELVEHQAHVFADVFLLTDQNVKSFDYLPDLVDYCDVPQDVAKRRWERIEFDRRQHFKPIYDGTFCPACGGSKVRSTLNYRRCDDCKQSRY